MANRREFVRPVGVFATVGIAASQCTQSASATSDELGITDTVATNFRQGEVEEAESILSENDVPYSITQRDLPTYGGEDESGGISIQRHYGGGNHDTAIWQLTRNDEYLAQNYITITGRNNLSIIDASMIPDAAAISYNGNHWFSKDPDENLLTWSESDKFSLDKNLGNNWQPGSGVAADVHVPSSWTPWPKSHRHGMETTLVHTGDDRAPIKLEYRHIGSATSANLVVNLPFLSFFGVENGDEFWNRAESLTVSDIEN